MLPVLEGINWNDVKAAADLIKQLSRAEADASACESALIEKRIEAEEVAEQRSVLEAKVNAAKEAAVAKRIICAQLRTEVDSGSESFPYPDPLLSTSHTIISVISAIVDRRVVVVYSAVP